MLRSSSLASYAIGIALLLGCAHSPCAAAPSQEVLATPKGVSSEVPKPPPTPGKSAPEKAKDGAATPGGTAAATAATPKPEGTAAPTEKPTQTTEACKKAIGNVVAGGLSALDSIQPQKRAAIMGSPTGVRLVTCLAIAGDDSGLCNSLPKDQKAGCLQDREVARELKGLPKGAAKGHIMHRLCSQGSPKAECDKMKAAITAGDATKCKGLTNASFRTFCEALASGDVNRCNPLPVEATEGPSRGLCAAFTSEDGTRCPKDSPDCVKLANTFATLKKQGLGGFQKSDPALAAASGGKQACAPLAKELESLCDDPK